MNLSNEDNLLLTCTRIKPDDKSIHKIKDLIGSGLNWEYIVEKVSQYGLASLLFHNLRGINENGSVPQEVMATLKKGYYENALRNMKLYNELGKALTVLKDAGIDAVVLKGAVLAETVYRDIGLRPMGDIDIMVRFDRKNENHVRIIINADTPPFDIHENLRGKDSFNRTINTQKLWENAEPIKLAKVNTLKLCPEHQLLHLIVHGNYFKGFIWLCDIAEFVRHYKGSMDWKKAISEAKQYGYKNLLFFQLYSARELLDAPVPDDVLYGLQPNWIKRFLINKLMNEMKFEQRKKSLFNKFFNINRPFKIHVLEALTIDGVKDVLKRIYFLYRKIIKKFSTN